ncbi:metallophosphoesterase [Candidatus Dependentiae bacterium]|nr:metallophosphoesterase [Candidatus Dependentiae bacterium]MBU4387170.1 metallophosphoesterase [Candidatus Dependentiae bacterium]MCG2755927.1 metallophosphoesterase [Candidatus Dependentiae bacterium]
MKTNRTNLFFLIVFLSFSLIQNLMCMRDKRIKNMTKIEPSQEYKKKKRSESIHDQVSEKILSDIVFNDSLDDSVLCDKYIFLNIDGFKESFKNELDLFRKNITKLIDNKNFKTAISLQEKDIYDQRSIYYGRLTQSKNLINSYSIGDIHASSLHLIKDLRKLKSLGVLTDKLELINLKNDNQQEMETYFINTGDIIDRGLNGAECIYLFMLLFNKNPNNVILLRGNHESFITSHNYGFSMEIGRYFSNIESNLFDEVIKYFKTLGKDINQDELDLNKSDLEKIMKLYFENSNYKNIISTLKLLPSTAFLIDKNKFTIQFSHGTIDTAFKLNKRNKKNAIKLQADKTFINDNYNKYIWGDSILDGDVDEKRNNSEGLSEKDIYQYMETNNINLFVCGHNHYSKNLNKYGFMYTTNNEGTKNIIRHIQFFGIYKYMPSIVNISFNKKININPIYIDTKEDLNIPSNPMPDFLRKNFKFNFLWWLKKQT